MKIIVKVDSDKQEILQKFLKGFEESIVILPQGEGIKIYTISDEGIIRKLEE
jgi:hypothetical protein